MRFLRGDNVSSFTSRFRIMKAGRASGVKNEDCSRNDEDHKDNETEVVLLGVQHGGEGGRA
jgi:hypothetical protein